MILDIFKIQEIIRQKQIDGWLLFDFKGSNELALEILNIPCSSLLTRGFYYYIPARGNAVKIVSAIEADNLAHLPGEELKYSSHESLKNHLRRILTKGHTVAMEYSPFGAIPYLSKVDAGTIEFIKAFGADIICSGDLITLFNALWSKEQFEDNEPVAKALVTIVKSAFKFIKDEINSGRAVNEYDVQCFIMNEFEKRGCITDHPPIVGANENAANPHYTPSPSKYKSINLNDFVLIDLWAKSKRADAVWADITWCGYVGKTIPEKYTVIFDIVKEARDTALKLVTDSFNSGKKLLAYEVDDAARGVIVKARYGEYFIHRTGHSITTELHGSGPHLDNFETRDERQIFPNTSFSIEPGIYLTGDFGVRLEIDVFIHPDGRVIYTGGEKQEELIAILA